MTKTLQRCAAIFIGAMLTLSAVAAQPTAEETKPLPYSDFQKGFMQIILEYAKKYRTAENDLQKSALVTERLKRFEALKGSPTKISGWYGVLQEMGTNGDGKAYVTISLSPNLLTISTWNNAFSDVNDKTLIPQSSPIYSKLAAMKKGNIVKFSGRLKRTNNLTEEGRMTSPNFIFSFTEIEKVGERAFPN